MLPTRIPCCTSIPFHSVPSEERLAQLNMELETNRVSALEENSRKEASNLSFEMSEADM